jgi:flagellar basal-body rod protein FlgB
MPNQAVQEGSVAEIVNDAAIMAALGRQLTQAVQRQSVAAINLANGDTPGYKAKEVQFSSLLEHELGGDRLAATNARHFGTEVTTSSRPTPTDVAGLSTRRDGNNVQVDHELLALGRAAGDFNAAQTVLAAKFRLVRYAINEGR